MLSGKTNKSKTKSNPKVREAVVSQVKRDRLKNKDQNLNKDPKDQENL
jgi:hypothetical protein